MPDYAVIYQSRSTDPYEFVRGPNSNQSFTAADGDNACAIAAVVKGSDGKYVAFDVTSAVPRNVTVVTTGQTGVTTF